VTAFRNPVFCALDSQDLGAVRTLGAALAPHVGGLKLGLEFFLSHGPAGIRAVAAGTDLPLFIDLKLHDIPNTVAQAVDALLPLSPAILTVHAAGGKAMLRAAADSAASGSGPRPRLVAVTILTSLDDADLQDIGMRGTAQDQVLRMADLALASGLDGIVCSPQEVETVRRRFGPEPFLVVPGIRPLGSVAGDQKRVMGPAQALASGASVLVIGRPITQASDPPAAAQAIAGSLGQ
jgi:orotidine-5'-phosphate decarboxylase